VAAPSGSTLVNDANDAVGRSRRKRRLRIAVAALLVAAVAAALVLLGPRALRRAVISEARARGVALQAGSIELGLGVVRLRRVRFSLLGVRGLSASATQMDIALRGLSPAGMTATEIDLSLAGLDALDDLPAWAAQYRARAAELPLSATGVRITWRSRAGEPEALALLDASLQTTPAGGGGAAGGAPGEPAPWTGALQAARVIVATKEVARTDVAWSLGAAGLSLGLGARDVPSAPVRAELRSGPSPTASVELAVAPLSSLAALLGLDVEGQRASAMTVAGKIELRLPQGADRTALTEGPIEGSFALTVKGFLLPHPRELDGLLFGDTTAVSAEARVSADRQCVTLTRVDIAAGALKLGGSGAIQRDGADASIGMDLSGSVPCSQLAGSAAMAHLSGPLGVLAGTVARRTLTGSVAVRLRVDARASRLAAARVEPSALFRCSAHF
jgi:ADP-dependent NAD(P)H-hydrate dehydratase / NAD(P)H-hydrate epimerase